MKHLLSILLFLFAFSCQREATILDTLDTYNGPKDRRFRIVHAQVISPGDFPRFQDGGAHRLRAL